MLRPGSVAIKAFGYDREYSGMVYEG